MHSPWPSWSWPASWTLRLPSNHGAAEAGRLADWQGPGRAYLATRGAEGSAETEAARAVVVQRWIVREAASTYLSDTIQWQLIESIIFQNGL
jgi:hypothetical protein